MAEIIPALTKEVLARMTAGEKRFAQRLKDLLEDDYLVWYDIPVGRERRYPDFIILHPARGLLFIEVKDWKPETLVGLDKHQAQLQLADGLKKLANPLEQARQCMIQVVNRLKQDKQMLFAEDSAFAGKICMPYGYGAVFTNITRKQIETGVSDADRDIVLPDSKVIYKDEMTESADAEVFQQRLWDMFQFRFGEKLSLPQIDRIRWHLFPEVRIRMQDDLFAADSSVVNHDASSINWADKQQESITADIPDIIRIMDVQQEQLARSLGTGHRVIHGVAGSGKTLILGYRAELLAATTTKPVLILCYNISLARKLSAIIRFKELSDRIAVMHFHDWCGLQLKTYHVNVQPGIEPYWERQVLSVIKGVDQENIPRAQYGAVLIDEGHDFEAQWLKLITQMINPESDSLLLLYDDAQSIYKKRSGLGFSLSSVGIKAQGRTTILRLNYRNTREILEFAYRFAADFIGAEDSDDDHIPLLLPESAGNHGPQPKVVRLSAWADELAYTVATLKAWKEQGLAWNDMTVLYANKFQGGGLSRVLKEAGIPLYWLGTSEYKKAYDPAKDQVAIMSMHSSKGLEFPAVIIVGADALNCEEQLEQNVRLLYVGMTRAQRYLQLTVSEETPLTALWQCA